MLQQLANYFKDKQTPTQLLIRKKASSSLGLVLHVDCVWSGLTENLIVKFEITPDSVKVTEGDVTKIPSKTDTDDVYWDWDGTI